MAASKNETTENAITDLPASHPEAFAFNQMAQPDFLTLLKAHEQFDPEQFADIRVLVSQTAVGGLNNVVYNVLGYGIAIAPLTEPQKAIARRLISFVNWNAIDFTMLDKPDLFFSVAKTFTNNESVIIDVLDILASGFIYQNIMQVFYAAQQANMQMQNNTFGGMTQMYHNNAF